MINVDRRTDYQHHLAALYGIPLLGSEYFRAAMLEQAKHQAGPTLFVVVTDDMAWARKNLDFPDLAVAFLGNSAILQKNVKQPLATGEDVGEDLALLAACNHSILSYGTFGQWSGLLAGGRVTIAGAAANTKEGREVRAAKLGWVWLGESQQRAVGGAVGCGATASTMWRLVLMYVNLQINTRM